MQIFFSKKKQTDNEVVVDLSSEPSKWFSVVDGEQFTLCYPFTMQTKRHVSDLYLNTNNPIVSNIFGYNNNVTMGKRNCIYYVTLYNTKGNQDEGHFPFLKHCTALAKRIRRLRQEGKEIEEQFRNNGEIGNLCKIQIFQLGWAMFCQGLWYIFLQLL